MRRRRRRQRGIWLPVLGSQGSGSTAGRNDDATMLLAVDVPTNGDAIVGVRPILFDTPQEPEEFTSGDIGLGQFIKNAYALRRLVGKVHVDWQSPAYVDGDPSGVPPVIQVTVGFFVARADDAQGPSGPDLPIGGLAALTTSYRPSGLDNIREPWIWRRQWLLGNPQIQQGVIAGDIVGFPEIAAAAAYPCSPARYGSVLDGPHIDAKTRRNVTSDDRLFVALEARTYPFGAAYTVNDPPAFVRAHLDIRAFGMPRRDRNRGSF